MNTQLGGVDYLIRCKWYHERIISIKDCLKGFIGCGGDHEGRKGGLMWRFV